VWLEEARSRKPEFCSRQARRFNESFWEPQGLVVTCLSHSCVPGHASVMFSQKIRVEKLNKTDSSTCRRQKQHDRELESNDQEA